MSGGVDSSTVAAILARDGDGAGPSRNSVVGLTLQLWDQTRLAGKHGIPDAATTTSGAAAAVLWMMYTTRGAWRTPRHSVLRGQPGGAL